MSRFSVGAVRLVAFAALLCVSLCGCARGSSEPGERHAHEVGEIKVPDTKP